MTPLAVLPVERQARIVEISAPEADAVRLKSLGFCVGRRIEAIKSGDPLVVRVMGSRVGLSARLAQSVVVEPV